MDSLSKYELKALMKQYKGPCVSIFMPTHRVRKLKNPVKFKNLLREAEVYLLETGIRTTTAKELLKPAQKLLRNGTFWRTQSDGLAVFLSPEASGHYRLPLDFEELVVVTKRFHIKPLLPLFSSGGRFYVLALSQNKVRLLQCTRYSVSEVKLEGVPEHLDKALKYDDPEKQLQCHTGTLSGRGKRAAIFHRHGVGTDDDETKLRYFRQIDKSLHKLLRNKREPLVLAGCDYLFPIYKKANTYPNLIDRGIAGNTEGWRAEALRARALAIVQPYLQKAQRLATAKYRKSAGTDRASNDIKEIVIAAYHGRIASLFVAIGVQRWGAFDKETNTVHLRQEAKSGDEDLLNLAATQTLLKGGHVYAVEPENVPDDEPLAAVFR